MNPKWKDRSVELLRDEGPEAITAFYLWVEPGPEGSVRQPNVLAFQVGPAASESQTKLLFTMTYGGDIAWE